MMSFQENLFLNRFEIFLGNYVVYNEGFTPFSMPVSRYFLISILDAEAWYTEHIANYKSYVCVRFIRRFDGFWQILEWYLRFLEPSYVKYTYL